MTKPKDTTPEPTRGETWAVSVRDAYDLNESEAVEVDLVASLMDAHDSLPPSEHVERRMTALAIFRGLSQLALPSADGETKPTLAASHRGRKAATARWANRNGVEA